jgi:hypothetical protein
LQTAEVAVAMDDKRDRRLRTDRLRDRPGLIPVESDWREMTGLKRNRQFFLAGVTESVVVAILEEVGGGIAGVEISIVVAVLTCEFQGVADAVVVAVGILDCDGVDAPPRNA